MQGISETMRRRMVELTVELDRAGVSPADQVAVFGAMLMVALAQLPGEVARQVFRAHAQACLEALEDRHVMAAGAVIRARRVRQ